MTFGKYVAFALMMGGSASAASAQGAAPAGKNLKEWLNSHLGNVVGSCLQGQARIKMRKKVNNSDIASVIPADLESYIQNHPSYWIVGETNAVRQFAYVSLRSEVESGQFSNNVKQYLATDFTTPSERLLLEGGVPVRRFEQSCEAAFRAAASAGGGLAGDTIKAAGEVTTSGKEVRRADIAAGTFVSPFTDAFTGPTASSDRRFYVAMLFWDWRHRNGNQDGFLLPQIDGYALRSSVESKFDIAAGADASVNFAIPFLSVRSSFDGQFSANRGYKAQIFELISVRPLSRVTADRYAIPAETELNAIISGTAKAISSHSGDGVLVSGIPNYSFVDVAWVPSKFCKNATDYEIGGDSRGMMSVSAVEEKAEQQSCRFSITYRPTQSQTNGSVDVPFSIRRRKTADMPSAMTGFEIPVAGLQYQWSDVPRLRPAMQQLGLYATEPDGDAETLVWRVTGEVLDKKLLKAQLIQINEARLAEGCNTPGKLSDPRAELELRDRLEDRINFVLIVKAKYQKLPAVNGVVPARLLQSCRLEGVINYSVGDRSISRPLSAAAIHLMVPASAAAR